MKFDELSDLVEQIEDLQFLKDEYRERINELATEIAQLHATDRQAFEEKLAALYKQQAAKPSRALDREIDDTIEQLTAYSTKMQNMFAEHKHLSLKLDALDSHIETHRKTAGETLLKKELSLTPPQTNHISSSHSPPPITTLEDDALKSLSEQWIQHKIRHGELKERSEQTYQQALNKFFDIMGDDIRLRDFDKRKAVHYVDQLSNYPQNRWKGKGRNTMTLDEVRNIESKRLSTSAIDDEIRAVGGMFEWLIQRGHIQDNMLKGLAPKVNKSDLSREPFEPEEVLQILSHPCFRGERPANWRKPLRPSYYWLPILAIFTGARVEELSRLRKKDVHEINGIMAVEIMPADLTPEITTRRKNTPGKSSSATRLIPVHSELSALGFLEFVQSCPDGYLFDQTTVNHRRGHSASRDLANIFREAGVKKTMHQLRHTMRDMLTEGGVDWAVTQGIMGHSPGGQSASYGKAIKQNIKALAPAYLRLSFAHLLTSIRPWGEISQNF